MPPLFRGYQSWRSFLAGRAGRSTGLPLQESVLPVALAVTADPRGVHPDIYIAEIVDCDDEGRFSPGAHANPPMLALSA
jgi:hypothetical protein